MKAFMLGGAVLIALAVILGFVVKSINAAADTTSPRFQSLRIVRLDDGSDPTIRIYFVYSLNTREARAALKRMLHDDGYMIGGPVTKVNVDGRINGERGLTFYVKIAPATQPLLPNPLKRSWWPR